MASLAARLSEDADLRVLLIGAGGRTAHWSIRMPAALASNFEGGPWNWCFYSVPQKHLAARRIFQPRVDGLGVSSAINGMAYIRGHALDYGTEFAQVAADVARRCGIEHLVSLNNGAASDYETGFARAEDAFETAALDITDTWMILYTSGTTGRPKGARITYVAQHPRRSEGDTTCAIDRAEWDDLAGDGASSERI